MNAHNTYLNAAISAYRRGQPGIPVSIATRTVGTITPSYLVETQHLPDGGRRRIVHARGYIVTFTEGRTTRRATTTADELIAVGLPVPPMPSADSIAPSGRL